MNVRSEALPVMPTHADAERLNAAWLGAWSAKDAGRLVALYAEDCVYRDPRYPDGLRGRTALHGHLESLFRASPPWVFTPDRAWPIAGGFCSRWTCVMGPDGRDGRLRGFDLVLVHDGLIVENEAYVHELG